MKKLTLLVLASITIILTSCNVEDIVSDLTNGKITAKEKLGEVMNLAKSEFAADAKLSAIYGSQINPQGEADLLNTKTISNFIYVVQSDSLQTNDFYVPVYAAGPIKSPVRPETMLSFIKDTTAKNVMSTILSTLASVHISPSAQYSDSPGVLADLSVRDDVKNFQAVNPGYSTDMFLLPSKSIDSTRVLNSADWIVNFYSDSSSLVLWINSTSGEVKNLSDL